MELESTVCGLVGAHRGKRGGLCELLIEEHGPLADRLAGFWNDRHVEWVELFVLLEEAGLTLEPDPEPVIRELPRILAKRFRVPELPSEDERIRGVVQARLDRLAESKTLRGEYVSLIGDLWGVAGREWRERGKGEAEALAASVESRLRAGESVVDILPAKHIALNDAMRPLLNGNQVVITPLGLDSSAKYILQANSGPVYVGFGDGGDRMEQKRQRREEAAAAFKVLSDPTRLGILEYLLHVPASVSDLARAFDVSQPTISAHVKLLRDAGLLSSTRKGAHTLYSANQEALRGSVERATESLTVG